MIDRQAKRIKKWRERLIEVASQLMNDEYIKILESESYTPDWVDCPKSVSAFETFCFGKSHWLRIEYDDDDKVTGVTLQRKPQMSEVALEDAGLRCVCDEVRPQQNSYGRFWLLCDGNRIKVRGHDELYTCCALKMAGILTNPVVIISGKLDAKVEGMTVVPLIFKNYISQFYLKFTHCWMADVDGHQDSIVGEMAMAVFDSIKAWAGYVYNKALETGIMTAPLNSTSIESACTSDRITVTKVMNCVLMSTGRRPISSIDSLNQFTIGDSIESLFGILNTCVPYDAAFEALRSFPAVIDAILKTALTKFVGLVSILDRAFKPARINVSSSPLQTVFPKEQVECHMKIRYVKVGDEMYVSCATGQKVPDLLAIVLLEKGYEARPEEALDKGVFMSMEGVAIEEC